MWDSTRKLSLLRCVDTQAVRLLLAVMFTIVDFDNQQNTGYKISGTLIVTPRALRVSSLLKGQMTKYTFKWSWNQCTCVC